MLNSFQGSSTKVHIRLFMQFSVLPVLAAGEYLKTKRSLIRADERLASMSERIESLKAALSKAGLPLPSMTDSPSARSDTSTNPFGTPRSVAGTPKTTAAQALEAHL